MTYRFVSTCVIVSMNVERLEISHVTAHPLPNAPGTNAPGTTAPRLDAPFANTPYPLVSDATRKVPVKKSPRKKDPWPKNLEVQTPLPANDPPGTHIYQLKRFRSKLSKTGPGKKTCHQ